MVGLHPFTHSILSPSKACGRAPTAILQALMQALLPGAALAPPPAESGRPASLSGESIPAATGSTSGSSSGGGGGSAAAPPPAGPTGEQGAGQDPADRLAGALACPLTGRRFVDPCIAPDGRSYEREALELWLVAHPGVSPVSGGPLPAGAAPRPNLALRSLLETL